jgi:hypothetical protein
MWLSKRHYEFLPYYYLGLGALFIVASFIFNAGYLSDIFAGVGVLGLVVGLVLWLKRRDYRRSRSRSRLKVEDQT